jgi:hypothetical protein
MPRSHFTEEQIEILQAAIPEYRVSRKSARRAILRETSEAVGELQADGRPLDIARMRKVSR